MKVFIWSSEYVAHIAIAENEETAKQLLIDAIGKEKDNSTTMEELEYAFKGKLVIIEGENKAIHLFHGNE